MFLSVKVAVVWFAKHAGVHIPLKQIDNVQGLKLTFFLESISIIASFILGVIAGMARLSKYPFISVPAIAYIELIRGVPLFMFIIYMFITIPQVVKGMEHISNWESALIAFILFTSTYIGEIVRAGIQSIDKGQWEAAHSLGLNYWLTMTQIILPQAIKRMIPPTVSQFIALFKDTSLAYYIGVIEFFRTITITYNREYNATFSLLLFGALVYFIFSYAMSIGAEKLRRSMGAQETT
jgi:polar amino acid transport system permease protein